MEGIGIVVWVLIAAIVAGLGDLAATYVLKRGPGATVLGGLAAALLGSFAWSEWFGQASTWGPELDGLYLLPALLGALILTVAQVLSVEARRKLPELVTADGIQGRRQ